MEFIDSIPSLFTWYDATQSLPESEKIRAFKSTVYSIDPAFYDFRFKGIIEKGENVDSAILKIFDDLDSSREKFELFHSNLVQNLEKGLKLMNNTFPDFKIDIPFHICHSLGECDGGTRKLNGTIAMILGIDIMAKVHVWSNEIPFIQHELFHIYHYQIFHPSNNTPYNEDAIYNGLWFEGLATYVSYLLNPNANFGELLLDTPPGLGRDTEKNKALIAKELLKNLYSHDPDIYGQFFLFRSELNFPKRCGYYIGFLLVKQMSLSYPLDKLIRLTEKEFIPAFESILNLFLQDKL